ncbi:MAG: nucleotidyltransferase domain-containing protein [Candidatus Saganbacteria bacterium]|nr:nucleotidyltransferase domain-containing protein [Candidatus Saganbacteria bacterium]
MHEISAEIKQKIVEIIKLKITGPRYKIFLFGSRTNGKATNRSDIDVGIDAKDSLPWSLLADIKEDLANIPILQKIDVVDFNNVADDFKGIALKDTEVLYEQ